MLLDGLYRRLLRLRNFPNGLGKPFVVSQEGILLQQGLANLVRFGCITLGDGFVDRGNGFVELASTGDVARG